MFIYELPFQIQEQLTRLLDKNDDWKELARQHMKYSSCNIEEMEAESKRKQISPTNHLFRCWGQQNHTVEELFVLFYRMKHVASLNCLVNVLDKRFGRLLVELESKMKLTLPMDENANKKTTDISQSSIPLPVIFMEKGVQQSPSPSANYEQTNTPTDESTTGTESKASSPPYIPNQSNADFQKSLSAIPMLSYEILREATDNWSESNLLGRGGFGQVYKGESKWKVHPMAIKRLLRVDDGRYKELLCELSSLNKYRHDNILPLYGYSIGGPEACLVYQLMCGGSLEQRLRSKTRPRLTWTQRYNIVHGVARGLAYLHTMEGSPLIHGDIKPANILLDQCTMPKIGDFGLARKGPFDDRSLMKVSKVHGTVPYLPEEYIRSRCLSPAVDVFSFGVVLLEVATALPALDRNREQHFLYQYMQQCVNTQTDLQLLEDKHLRDTPQSNPILCREFIRIGIHCTKSSRIERPTMLDVYRTLDGFKM